ncbi:MAG: hypothetical protein MZU95_13040 [Desulfomicrobium escambiense]|nr:hypothetical protein [Desulfomicrobium escambiense]
MDLLEMISGNRVHYAINTIGGVRRDLDETQKAKILEGVATLRKRSEYYLRLGASEPSFVGRIAGVGMPEQGAGHRPLRRRARRQGLRASAADVRKDDPYAVYDELDFEVCTADTCDVLGRVVVRVKELLESYKMIEQMVKGLPDGRHRLQGAPQGQARTRPSAATKRPAARTSTTSRPTGRTSPSGSRSGPRRSANYPATVEMLQNGFIADIPLIFAAIDPCICCAERAVTLVGARSGEESVVRMQRAAPAWRSPASGTPP